MISLRRSKVGTPFILLVCGYSCGPPEEDPATLSAGFSARDSAGIQIAENGLGAWTDLDRWKVDPDPVLVIGRNAESPGEALYLVGNVDLLSDGRVLVENRSTREILVFDQEARLVGTWGGEGDGPREFRVLRGAFRCGQDHTLVNGGRRATLFDAEGEVLWTQTLPPGGDRAVGVSTDCHRILIVDDLGEWYPGAEMVGLVRGSSSQDSNRVFTVSTVFWVDLIDLHTDTLGVFPTEEFFLRDTGGNEAAAPAIQPFGLKPVWATDGSVTFFGLGDRAEIQTLGEKGRIRSLFRWDSEKEVASEEEWAEYMREREAAIQYDPHSERGLPTPEEFPTPTVRPLFASETQIGGLGALSDDEGNLWVRQYSRPSILRNISHLRPLRPAGRWWIFNAEGRLLGEIETPANFSLRTIRDRFLLGVSRDQFDVEEVRLYRLQPEGPTGSPTP